MTSDRTPQRKCVGCGKSFAQVDLIRVKYSDGALKIDSGQNFSGRSIYICRDKKCIENAFRRNGFAKSLRKNISREELEILRGDLDA